MCVCVYTELTLHNAHLSTPEVTHLDLSRCPSIAAQKLATSTLMTAPLKVVTIECIEHDVTCLSERVFIKTVNHLLTNCSQSTLLAMVCRLSLLVLNTS